jgi:ketosteroid isomerase-like protein
MEIPISLKLKLMRVAPCVFVVALSGCTQAPCTLPDTREADAKAVRETDAAKMRAWTSKDADKIAFFFADDATHFSPNMPALKGRQSIRETFKERLADPNSAVSAEATVNGHSSEGPVHWRTSISDPGSKLRAPGPPFSHRHLYACSERRSPVTSPSDSATGRGCW